MSEREIEVPWALTGATGEVLDVGCAESDYLTRIHVVDGIDPRPIRPEGLRNFYVGDIREFDFGTYDTVLAISTLEHVGLDAYDQAADDPDGDRHALDACVRVCRPGGKVLVSVPFGQPADYGWFRQYNFEALDRLFDGYQHTTEIWVNSSAGWVQSWEPDETLCYGAGSAAAVALMEIRC